MKCVRGEERVVGGIAERMGEEHSKGPGERRSPRRGGAGRREGEERSKGGEKRQRGAGERRVGGGTDVKWDL